MTVLVFDARRKLSWIEWRLDCDRHLFPQLVRIGRKSPEEADCELRLIEGICDDYRALVADDRGTKCSAGT